MASTSDILDLLDELAQLTTLKEGSPQSFKVRAYENAKQGIMGDGRDITQLPASELVKIRGVGKSTASKIREFMDTGSVDKLEQLRREFPPSVVALSRIPGVGPKTLSLLRRELGIEDLDALQSALEDKRVRELKGLGAKAEQKIATAIQRLGLSGKDRRRPIAEALPLAERLVAELESHDVVERALYCGSIRRMNETIGDVDITVASADGPAVMGIVRSNPAVHEVILSGDTKTSFLTRDGLQVDVRVVALEQFGAATLYFTGSKAHNIALRQRAIDRGLLLNEYGLLAKHDEEDDSTVDEVIAAATEESIYSALDMSFVPAVMRENTGEVEAAAGGSLPDLVQMQHIRGDLHYHTDRSGDGRSSVEDMLAEAAARGYEYLAITDHGEDLAINGSSAEEMLDHRDHIAEAANAHPQMTVLWGCELNIGAGGGLDYDGDFRALFDYTVASVHSHYDQSVRDQTARLVAAIADPTVHSIGHLTGRYIGRRPGIEIDVDVVLEALFQFDKALEINGALQRLDAASDVVRKAVDRGVKLVINTDSHHTSELGRMTYGVLTAQRGWVPRELVVNTWPKKRLLDWVG
jgi:DNA polymerase (family 10)